MRKFRWAYIGSGNIAKSTAKSIEKGNHIITAVYGKKRLNPLQKSKARGHMMILKNALALMILTQFILQLLTLPMLLMQQEQ